MKKDRNKVVERLKNKIRPENRIFIRKNLAISEQVQYILEQKGWTQKDLANNMGKHESEISKWLTGLHNLTIQSISLMEAALEAEIIITPLEVDSKFRNRKYKNQSVISLAGERSISKELK
jgi:transcriptional regulator with XRE-family HTH domain